MQSPRIPAFALWMTVLNLFAATPAKLITTGTLLREMTDLDNLAQRAMPAYRTVQFSSYDRRSTTSDAPGWFSNADGFGNEPIPGFLKVLREPAEGRPGLYLVAEVKGPGAIVRGWSAGMAGVLRVCLDPSSEFPGGVAIWEGPAYDFLARRSSHYFKSCGLDMDAGDAFIQQDADYLPIPFASGLRVTWEGSLRELHFYHLQVRIYDEGASVRTFDAKKDMAEFASLLQVTASQLNRPRTDTQGDSLSFAAAIEPGRAWTWSPSSQVSGAIRELRFRLQTDHAETALRGCLLRIAFDGSQRPQVESPLGDFFGSGPGVNPFSSLPVTVEPDGFMACRFTMPFEKSFRIELVNHTTAPLQMMGSVRVGPWTWDDRSLHFRARWRADHDLLAGAGSVDLPFLTLIGQGKFAGCAVMVMNPTGAPMAGGNWWGEGDEKIMVDGESVPSTFGTGSEDYFNYSWSRPDLFDHPYCGQPLDSGPDTAGYVSNHRFQVLDAIPFERSLAVLFELWPHNRTPGLSYARIVYHYARPDGIDDHRALMPSDLKVPLLPVREPLAVGGAAGARFHFMEDLQPTATAGKVEQTPLAIATRLRVVKWQASQGERLRFNLPVEKDGRHTLHMVAVHRPGGASLRMLMDGRPLQTAANREEFALESAHVPRVLNVHFKPVEIKAGSREITLECLKSGVVGLDYLWVK